MLAQQQATVEIRDTLWRTLMTFAVTRGVIAVVLLLYLTFNLRRTDSPDNFVLYWQTCSTYLLFSAAFAFLALRRQRHFLLQLWTQLTIDLVAISLLLIAAGGSRSGLAILYLFPLAGGAILAPLVVALFFAALATIFLLAQTGYEILTQGGEATISQAGLYGAAFFSVVFVINRLAARLIKEEAVARQRGVELRTQEAINRLIIADMGDGILVVDADGTMLTANPAAERMLGLVLRADAAHEQLDDVAALAPIAEAFRGWTQQRKAGGSSAAAPAFVMIKPGDDVLLQLPVTLQGGRRELIAHLKLQFASIQAAGTADQRTVIFMQDVTEIENQAQQLKLAAMGRLTASIAHEVRNPLSAIAHASSLLSEEPANPMQTRLLHIVSDNVARLNRMIEDILKLSRKAQMHDEPLALAPFIAAIVDEFKESHALPPGMVALGDTERYRVWFDPLHLREVITNLLSNALRYASGKPDSIRIFAVLDTAQRLELHVQDDGAPITLEVRAHLFEPFYTTSSKGTGLGLYLARELCLNNGARIDYEYRSEVVDNRFGAGGGRFVITFAETGSVGFS
jgi:two-component system sensor histidine kinase PilS (NtrC family)